jgi:hypothetical protein|nr:hypothetical protein [Kofleriaceae bacterium]
MRRLWVIGALGACSFAPHAAGQQGSDSGTPRQHDAAPGMDASGDHDAKPIDAKSVPLDATPPAFALDGMQWEIDCKANLDNATPPGCSCDPTSPGYTKLVSLAGEPTDHWAVTLRVAGAMEPLAFKNGSAVGSGSSDGFYIGGDKGTDNGDNLYRIDVSSPAQHYFLNNGRVGQNYSTAFDYTVTIPIDGNATVTFTASPQDSAQWQGVLADDTTITLPGVTPPPATNSLVPQWAFVIVQSASPM